MRMAGRPNADAVFQQCAVEYRSALFTRLLCVTDRLSSVPDRPPRAHIAWLIGCYIGNWAAMLSQNITESTCSYGLAQTSSGCERTLASFDEDAYLKAQIIYLAFGLSTIAVTGVMYYRSVKYDATKLQQHSFLLTSYAALTFIFRGADPGSYRHVVPRPFTNFFSDSCTSALYAV